MNWTLEVVFLAVTDVDRARDFYANQVGFHLDHDHTISEELRFVQLTPPGSGCSIAFGKGLTESQPGAGGPVMLVVDDIEAARAHLVANGVDASPVDVQAWGHFVYFSDPDGNDWTVQYLPYRHQG